MKWRDRDLWLWLSCIFLAVGGYDGAVVALPANQNMLNHRQTTTAVFEYKAWSHFYCPAMHTADSAL